MHFLKTAAVVIILWITAGNISLCFNVIPKSPLFCNTSVAPKIFQLNPDIDCEQLLSTNSNSKNRNPANATLYKLNLSKYNTVGWSCQKILRTLVVYKGIDHTHLLSDNVQTLPLTRQECQSINETKTCVTGNNNNNNLAGERLYKIDDQVWSTNVSALIHAKLFQTKAYNVTNCFLSKTELWINRLTNRLESSLGAVAHCSYGAGQCELTENRMLIWQPDSQAQCTYLPWRTLAGYYDYESASFYAASGDNDGSSASSNEPIVLTFPKNVPLTKLNNSCGHEFYQSDQGLGVAMEFESRRQKRNAIDTAGYDPITQGEVNMKLQGVVQQLLKSPDVNGHSLACVIAQEIAFGWHDEIVSNPTLVVRRILRNSNLKAELHGRAVFMWNCTSIDNYQILPMKKFCTELIPIAFNVTTPSQPNVQLLTEASKNLVGYLNPFTNEIQPTSSVVECDQLNQPMILELNNKTYWYDYSTGAQDVSKMPDFSTFHINSLTGSRNATNSRLDSVIYRSNSMYTRQEYMHFVDLNDLHRNTDVENQKKKVLFDSLSKYSNEGVMASSSDLIRSIGDILSHFGSWWSYLYWFAVAAGAIVVVFFLLKFLCFCNTLLSCCSVVDSPKFIYHKKRKIYCTKNGETFV